MLKITIDNEEVLSNKDFTITEEMLNTPSVVLDNVYPKSWEQDKDYTTRFYHPNDYSKCIIEDITPLLPTEYTQLDYIQSSGSQYIDTGMKFNQNSGVEMQISDLVYRNTKIFGSRSSATSNNYSILSTSTTVVLDFYNYNNNRLNETTPTEPITISMNNQVLRVNETTKNIGTYNSFTTPGNAYIFGASGSYASGYTNASMKLYYCKIWQNNNLVRDYIPCKRNSDNAIGLYDLVNNSFYINAGSGSFIGGEETRITSNLLFCGIVKNSGNISLNPRYPHYQSLQILDFKTFLSEGETLDFVIANKTIEEAIDQVISTISPYGFVKGNIEILGADTMIGAYSTKDKTAYDVFNYLADITQSRWTTRMLDENTVAIDFYDPTLLPQGTTIEYTQEFFRNNLIDDMSYSYGSNDYRNKQVMTSKEVIGNLEQSQLLYANGYQTQFLTEINIANLTAISVNGTSKSFATNDDKELGVDADFYYTIGNNIVESTETYSTGTTIEIRYLPIVEGRQIITNNDEIERVSTATGRKGIVARYEDRNDATTSMELQLIGQSYIKYKGVPEIKLTIQTRSNLWEVGNRVQFNAPIPELATEYMVKSKNTNYIASIDTIFYTYELTSSFNSEQAINYFDNQRAKARGNIGEGEYITRNIDIENEANIIFYDSQVEESEVVGNNILNSVLNSPLNN